MTIVHGGNVYELSALAGCSPEEILDFSASINPLGPPPGLEEELSGCFGLLQSYPDIHCRKLIEAISNFHGVDPACIVVTNGSTELIYWLPRALGVGRALAVLPAFGEYVKAFELHGTRLEKLFPTPGECFQPGVEQLEAALRKEPFDAVLLTNPSSPAGSLLGDETLDWIVKKSAGSGPIVLVDEVFVDFCEEASLRPFVEGARNLALIRSFTKFYGLPGLRIGYLLAPPGIAERVRGFLPPWSVSTHAQAAGAFCLGRQDYRLRTLELIAEQRRNLTLELSAIPGLEVFPGAANFLLVRMHPDLPPASGLKTDIFKRYRILIRDCGSFEGLGERYFRVAVRLPDQNNRLIAALKDVLSRPG
ncbi:MAG: threonine-phosphate decarboxylase CobD [Syntrophobacteraceae bacterium]|nr:threonine-phosphate decarboxylase CobD [Syntrophobacteraceae bacterium]